MEWDQKERRRMQILATLFTRSPRRIERAAEITDGEPWTGVRVKAAREALGMTQMEAGRFLDLAPAWISQVESGKKPVPLFAAIVLDACVERRSLVGQIFEVVGGGEMLESV